MDGARDSEIAMGAYQPYHLATREPARGQVHGFRMALWYEHLGMLDDTFQHPESTECVKKLTKSQTGTGICMLVSSRSLASVPHWGREGNVTELPGTELFPDTKARVLGAKVD